MINDKEKWDYVRVAIEEWTRVQKLADWYVLHSPDGLRSLWVGFNRYEVVVQFRLRAAPIVYKQYRLSSTEHGVVLDEVRFHPREMDINRYRQLLDRRIKDDVEREAAERAAKFWSTL